MTWSKLYTLQETIGSRYAAGAPLPADQEQLIRELALEPKAYEDAWSRPVRYRPGGEQEEAWYTLSSAGADGHFGTDDDIVRTINRYGFEIKKAQ